MRTRAIDYAYTRTKPITRKIAILAAFDAFIAGMVMVLFLGILLTTLWLIFGH